MSDSKTKPTSVDPVEFIHAIENENKRNDALQLLEIFRAITQLEPIMWGSIIGFGSYHYRYDSGREGDCLMTGFAPRAQNFSLYVMLGFADQQKLLDKLGKHKTGKSCLYIKKLDDVDLPTLKKIIAKDFKAMRKKYGSP